MKQGTLFVISAPSGTGKSTIVRRLCEEFPELHVSVSSTTRQQRPSEVMGRDYDFISRKEFQRRIDEGFFVEWAEVHGALYGTPKKPLKKMLAEGKSILMDVDVQGGMALKKAFPRALTIFLLPPSFEVLESRLRQRGTDAESQVEKRLIHARKEINARDHYDHAIINDDLNQSVAELKELIQKHL